MTSRVDASQRIRPDHRRPARADFVHKLGIALKELRESRVWLKACMKSELLATARLLPLTDECTQLMNIVGKSIVTAKSNAPEKPKRQTPPPNTKP
jgi:four helix bundle protein